MNETKSSISRAAILGIVVSALGFFVDLYDMMIFSAVKDKSFKALNLLNTNNEWTIYTRDILSMQMLGMILGGFIWGSIGDKFGRLKVLFGSILMYSVFTFLNAYITTIEQYKWCRFLAGIGLAGELGAGITLVTEQMPKKYRGFAVALVGSIGMLGAVAAGLVAKTNVSWGSAYVIGSIMGLALLVLRLGVLESGLFAQMNDNKLVSKGNFLTILKNKKLLWKFICVLFVGLPGWYATGILINHTSKIAQSMEMNSKSLPDSASVLMYNFLGFAFGDIVCGLLSQKLKSRKKAIFIFLALYSLFVLLYFTIGKNSLSVYYSLFVGMGISVGFSIMLFTLAAEQFGTNVRTLVTSTCLNLVRGWVIPLGFLFTSFASWFNGNFAYSAILLGIICLALAFTALTQLEETFDKELNYYEN